MALILSETLSLKDFEKHISIETAKIIDFYDQELKKIRTSRPTAALVEDIKITAYGSQIMPLKSLAIINIPDSTTLVIQPFDPSVIPDIEKSLLQSDLGIQPRNDGKTIKLTFPPMSKERRLEMVKIVNKKQEEANINIRKIRQDILNLIKGHEKDKKISEDCSNRFQKTLQNSIDTQIKAITVMTEKKSNQLMEG